MRHGPANFLLFASLLVAMPAAAEGQIGLSVPLGDTSPLLAAQMEAGARAAAARLEADILVKDDGCTTEGGERSARAFVEAQVNAVVGYLCTPAIEAALPILTQAGIPVIATGVRTDSLTDRRERTGWQVFRLGPRAAGEHEAASRYVVENWRETLFAIIDDGTIYGRELAEAIRNAAEQSSLSPVFVDTFRPQLDNQIGLVGRLRRSGATHVFVGGDREDIAIIARDAQGLDYDLEIAGGEALRAAPGETDLPDGVIMIAATRWADDAAQQSEISAERHGYFLPTEAAVEIVVEATLQDGNLADAIATGSFETVLGQVTFDAKGDMQGNLYRVYRYDGSDFVAVED
ncbi:ABC transporter substrate-binding protein [Aliihoeflea sp. PC F10.4]